MADILVVDDEIVIARSIVSFLERRGFSAEYAADAAAARVLVERNAPRLVILDYRLEADDGLDLLDWIMARGQACQVVMMTGYGDISVAVAAMKRGARDFLTKPVPLASIGAMARELMLGDLAGPDATGAERIVGRSAAANALRAEIRKLAEVPSRPGVLILGKRGTGKALAARALHEERGGGTLVEFDCALAAADPGALDRALDKAGTGTLVLRDIASLPQGVQVQLEARLAALGAAAPALVSTAARPLMPHEDTHPPLVYRLQVGWIDMPSLAERSSDIVPIAETTARRIARAGGLPRPVFENAARARLLQHGWPGEVAELVNCIERAMLGYDGEPIGPDRIRPMGAVAGSPAIRPLEDLEVGALRQALETTRGNVSRAATLLGISRDTMRYRMEKFGLPRR